MAFPPSFGLVLIPNLLRRTPIECGRRRATISSPCCFGCHPPVLSLLAQTIYSRIILLRSYIRSAQNVLWCLQSLQLKSPHGGAFASLDRKNCVQMENAALLLLLRQRTSKGGHSSSFRRTLCSMLTPPSPLLTSAATSPSPLPQFSVCLSV